MTVVPRQARRNVPLLGAAALLLLALVAGSVFLVFRGGDTFRQIGQERELRRAAGDLLSALQDAETGERGYLLTGEAPFLEPYEDAFARLPALRQDLSRAVAQSPDLRLAVMVELDPLIDRRLALLASGIAMASRGSPDMAAVAASERQGKAAMDAIRGLLTPLIDRADRRLDRAVAAQTRLSGWTQGLSLLAGLGVLLGVGAAVAAQSRNVVALRGADGDLRRLNADLEARVESRTRGLIRANQEVQRFAYIVTHDLRAPLVNIMGFTSELEASLTSLQGYVLAEGEASERVVREARVAAGEDLPEAIGFIRASTRKMDALINAILRISRDGRRDLRPERLALAEMAQGALDAVAHQIAETGGAARVEGSLAIVSDRLSVEQALGNLIDNAVKYRAPGRPLDLVVRLRPDGPASARIEVEDNGRGIAEADRERVFELFRRAGRPDAPGEGIGLAHVRSLVRNLGGEVTLRSVEGEGSTFTIELPSDLRRVREAAS